MPVLTTYKWKNNKFTQILTPHHLWVCPAVGAAVATFRALAWNNPDWFKEMKTSQSIFLLRHRRSTRFWPLHAKASANQRLSRVNGKLKNDNMTLNLSQLGNFGRVSPRTMQPDVVRSLWMSQHFARGNSGPLVSHVVRYPGWKSGICSK